jgi:hypothetical protein
MHTEGDRRLSCFLASTVREAYFYCYFATNRTHLFTRLCVCQEKKMLSDTGQGMDRCNHGIVA